MATVEAAVEAALARASGPVFVGFSGGRDSTVLLHAVAARRARGVVAVHVNHGLDPACDQWQARCAAVAARLEVGYLARRVEVSRRGSLEAAARAARYRVFDELLASSGSVLFVAHHRQDQTETAMLRLLQGRGLYGMPARRVLGAGTLVRPLLQVDPEQLERYARDHQLRWVDDPSNTDPRLDRSFLRHRVLPLLRERWPDLDGAVHRAMESLRLAERRLTSPIGDLAAEDSLEVSMLDACSEGEGVELLRLWVQAHGLEAPRRPALREWLRQVVGAGADRRPLMRLGGARLARHRGRVHLVRETPALADRYPVTVPGTTALPHGDLVLSRDAAGFRPVGDPEVRFRHGGERLCVGGHHRSLKRLFQEAGVPPWQRVGHPLLFDRHGLLAVPGVAVRDRGPTQASGGWRADWRPRR